MQQIMATATNFENVLMKIQGEYISLPEHEVKENNRILDSVITQLIAQMRTDPIFRQYFKSIFASGSFYDGLKVAHPQEYDLMLLFDLPPNSNPQLSRAELPDFVRIEVPNLSLPHSDFNTTFLVRSNGGVYLSAQNALNWMKGTVARALRQFSTSIPGRYQFLVDSHKVIKVTVSESGPAITLKMFIGNVEVDVDLVLCFQFSGRGEWNMATSRSNPTTIGNSFFIAPKIPKEHPTMTINWRLSFQQQERQLILGKRTLKPTIKLIKRLRDAQNHNISSYAIKTVFLWEIMKKPANFWEGTLTNTFLNIFEIYIQCIEAGEVPNFWNPGENLLRGFEYSERVNVSRHLRNIQKDIAAKYTRQPYIICQYLDVDARRLQTETNFYF